MHAAVLHAPKDLRVEEAPTPQPQPHEVLMRIEYGGICGSDLHYFLHGSAGVFQMRDPLILGHEIAGHIAEVGADVSGLAVGQTVTAHPAAVCGDCAECRSGQPQLCRQSRYFGSAAHHPHIQGGFAQYRAIPASQIRPLPDGLTTRAASVAEPLGVALHAIHRAGTVAGKRILVNGAGPIGGLIVAAAKSYGAAEVFASDLSDHSLAIASAMGADHTVNVAAGADLPQDVDVVFEASGATVALAGCFASVRRGGTVIQVGNVPSGENRAALGAIVNKEINYLGSFRFHDEITEAVALLAEGLDIEPIISHTFPLVQAPEAFATAADRTVASKVLLNLA